jgi:hypothetical protein
MNMSLPQEIFDLIAFFADDIIVYQALNSTFFLRKLPLKKLKNAWMVALETQNTKLLEWLKGNNIKGIPLRFMDIAAEHGFLKVLKWTDENMKEMKCTVSAIDSAAENGHLETVKWLNEYRKDLNIQSSAMDFASRNGHLAIVKYLNVYRKYDFASTFAIVIFIVFNLEFCSS